MRRLMLTFALITIVAAIPAAASAAVRVTIQVLNADGTVFQSGPLTGFNLSAATVPGSFAVSGNTTLTILSSSPRFFPSGGTSPTSSDTFRIENVSTSNLFRCVKTDPLQTTTVPNPAQLLEVKGLKATVTSAGSGKKLRVLCQTDLGDYRTLTSTSGVYTAKAALKGEMRNSTSTTNTRNVARACVPSGFLTNGTPIVNATTLQNPCLKLELSINSLPVNGQGLSTLISTSVGCSNSFDVNNDGKTGDAPCGPSGTGTWNPGLSLGDQFSTSDQGTVSCGTTCAPIYKVTTTAGPLAFAIPPGFTTAQGEFVKLTNSASVGIADGGVEDPLGRENLEVALANEVGTNTWLGYCGNLVGAKVVPQPPLTNQTKNSGSANIPLKFGLTRADFVTLPEGTGFTMESVGTGDDILPLNDRNSDDACYEIHIPAPGGQLKNVTDVTLTYEFVTTSQTSSYPTLATAGPLDYTDCFDACFRAYISLQDKFGVFRGRLVVYLGNGADFKGLHVNGNCCSGINLVGLADARVDASQMQGNLAQPCCISFADAQKGQLGNLFVRAFIVVLDQGHVPPLVDDPAAGNHRVVIHDAVFNGSHARNFLEVAGPYTASCDWPPVEGLRMVVVKRNADGTRTQVATLGNLTIDPPPDCFLRTSVTVIELNPDPNGNTYEVWVQQDAAQQQDPTRGGVSLPDVGVMNIFAL